MFNAHPIAMSIVIFTIIVACLGIASLGKYIHKKNQAKPDDIHFYEAAGLIRDDLNRKL
ncbi:hypothetical protein [Vibrio phage BONAISHI]|nr:hypothetical protein [Vibrio phage BONAISHI]